MAQEKQGWDTRAWLIGLLGGSVCGGVTAWSTYPPLGRRLDVIFPLNLAGTHGGEAISMLFGVTCLLVLPAVVSAYARRLTFLWGLIPLMLFLVSIGVEGVVEKGIGSLATDFWVSLAIIGSCLLVSSGPVSLFRWLRARARHRQEKAHAFVQAQREAASIPREGVWPPPPDYRP